MGDCLRGCNRLRWYFYLVSSFSPEQSTKVKNYIIEILSALVQDGESLSQEVMDIILFNILDPIKVRNEGGGIRL